MNNDIKISYSERHIVNWMLEYEYAFHYKGRTFFSSIEHNGWWKIEIYNVEIALSSFNEDVENIKWGDELHEDVCIRWYNRRGTSS